MKSKERSGGRVGLKKHKKLTTKQEKNKTK